jgi:hypothetical protein
VAAELSTTEGAVLLGLSAVGGEGVGKSADGGSGVDARSVVNGLCKVMLLVLGVHLVAFGAELLRREEGRIPRTRDGPLADEADQGSPGSVVESDGGTHFDVRWV